MTSLWFTVVLAALIGQDQFVLGQDDSILAGQDFQFLGLFQMQPAQTATVPTYALPDSPVDTSSSVGTSSDAQALTNAQLPSSQQLSQLPSFVYLENNQQLIPAMAVPGSSPQFVLSSNLPQMTQQFPSAPSHIFPQFQKITTSPVSRPVQSVSSYGVSPCEMLMQMVAAQNQLGASPQLYSIPQAVFRPKLQWSKKK